MADKINTILFDFDGTLLDTNELIIQTFMAVLGKHYPGRFDREDCLSFIGPSLKETFDSIDPAMTEQLVREYREWNAEMHDEMVAEYPAVTETLRLLKAKGLKLAVVSTKRRDVLARGMALMGVEDVFDCVIGLDDVTRPKPDPEPLQKAMDLLGAEPSRTLMVGDNSHDIEGGKNAGTRTAGVAWSAKGEAFLAKFEPDYMLHGMGDLLEIVDSQVKAR
ncbi:pyrophosphatase PpaX [Bhargavaea ullalensis]|uniref:Pyrophosphatase PpaX n=1 Tax=Bhargavaea ullalensis TaxID=1265685 RepID=A0ABV2GEI3_9BACL